MANANLQQSRQSRLNELLSTSKNKSYFVAAATTFFFVVMMVGGVLPSYTAFTAQGEQNVKRQEAIDKLQTKVEALQSLEKQAKDNPELIDNFNFIFPDGPDQINIVNDLNKIASSDKVFIQATSFSEIRNINEIAKRLQVPRQIKAQSVTVLLDGVKDDLIAFVKDAENNPRIINPINVLITQKVGKELEDSLPNRQYKLNFQFEFYYFDPTAK
jgi:hypothetical protein